MVQATSAEYAWQVPGFWCCCCRSTPGSCPSWAHCRPAWWSTRTQDSRWSLRSCRQSRWENRVGNGRLDSFCFRVYLFWTLYYNVYVSLCLCLSVSLSLSVCLSSLCLPPLAPFLPPSLTVCDSESVPCKRLWHLFVLPTSKHLWVSEV